MLQNNTRGAQNQSPYGGNQVSELDLDESLLRNQSGLLQSQQQNLP